MLGSLREQIAAYQKDPAATGVLEIVLCYPGLHAILLHRFSHWLYGHGLRLLPRVLSQAGRFWTGIEIHPGARIGRRLFIDHGMGVVIGETAEIGDDVLLYQGVTLGGTGKECGKRHPTLGDHVVIGTGAAVLGNITLGDHVKVGAGSVVIRSVPDHSTVVGVPGRIVRARGGDGSDDMEHGRLPDPQGQAVEDLTRRLDLMEAELRVLRLERAAAGPGA